MLEKTIEKKVVEHAKKLGFWTRKFVSPNNRGVPDRIFAYKGRIFFIEFKAPGKKLTALQNLEHSKMADAGMHVYVVDDAEQAKKTFEDFAHWIDEQYATGRVHPNWVLPL